jgi:hypothetical protein
VYLQFRDGLKVAAIILVIVVIIFFIGQALQ